MILTSAGCRPCQAFADEELRMQIFNSVCVYYVQISSPVYFKLDTLSLSHPSPTPPTPSEERVDCSILSFHLALYCIYMSWAGTLEFLAYRCYCYYCSVNYHTDKTGLTLSVPIWPPQTVLVLELFTVTRTSSTLEIVSTEDQR